MIKNHMREYDKMSTYWHVDTIDKFENVEVHGIVGDIKYLCCISCQSEILGYWLISVSTTKLRVIGTERNLSRVSQGAAGGLTYINFNEQLIRRS